MPCRPQQKPVICKREIWIWNKCQPQIRGHEWAEVKIRWKKLHRVLTKEEVMFRHFLIGCYDIVRFLLFISSACSYFLWAECYSPHRMFLWEVQTTFNIMTMSFLLESEKIFQAVFLFIEPVHQAEETPLDRQKTDHKELHMKCN